MLLDLFRQISSPTPTVQGLADEWLADAQARLRPDWFKEAKRLLAQHALPTLGPRRVDKVANLDMSRVLKATRSRRISNVELGAADRQGRAQPHG